MQPTGKVFLVGAGPGDPRLLTLRGRELLSRADVVLYDALVHPELLDLARSGTELSFVGKRGGQPSARQTRINQRMIDAARAGKLVVRLKGGDPFLFGRGTEELRALAAAHVPFEVVPGVSSPSAAAAYAGVAPSHRALSSSVAYVTATESSEKDASVHDWSTLATATQTLVIFMGMRKLESLAQLLITHGRSAETPAAIVEWASLPRQRSLVAPLGEIAGRAREQGLAAPALFVVGEVVGLRDELRWFDRLPLFGKRVLVTRPRHQARAFSRRLREAGAEAVERPSVRIVDPRDPARLSQAARDLPSYQAVVFTSANGVTRFLDAIAEDSGDARRFGQALVAAIGPKTAAALAERGLVADVVPREYRGEAAASAVLEALAARGMNRARVLLPRAEVAREVLPEALREAGHEVDVVPAYRTLPPDAAGQSELRRLCTEGRLDVVTFTSSSTVTQLWEALGEDALELLSKLTLASIGPITTATAEALGLKVAVTATEYTTEGLARALEAHYGSASNDGDD
ncbi:MAG: uroporphyrinogen-III C-methyltransferase [Deltaproteobacteria bacterium]|nr:uroporphyrinogen-III C-methyltransferase [Deltaproteobacteria bacterium]